MSSDSVRGPAPREKGEDIARPLPVSTSQPGAAAFAFPAVVIAIDGPAGSGKTTLAMSVAARLRGVSLHTGRHYRSVALAAIHRSVPIGNEDAVLAMLDGLAPTLDEAGDLRLLGTSYRAEELESAEVDTAVSTVAGHPGLRALLVGMQRFWVATAVRLNRSVIIEGRDACTRIAPDTPFRYYLHASAEERNARRERQRSLGWPEGILNRDVADEGLGRTTCTSEGVTVIAGDGLDEAELLARIWSELPSEIRHRLPLCDELRPHSGHDTRTV